jgi:lysophospholipase L1-like esterase
MTILFILLACSSLVASNFQEDLKNETIILIGDSQMEGKWGTMGPRLEEILIKRGAKVFRLGVGASGASFWSKTLNGKRSRLTTKRTRRWTPAYLKKLNPTQIIVSLGGNDSSFGKYGKRVKTVRYYHLKYTLPLMKKLKAITTNVSWFGPAHRWQSEYKIKKRIKVRRGRKITSEILKEIAFLSGVRYVSMLDWVLREKRLENVKPRRIRYDKVHYKDRGLVKSATWYAEALAKNIYPTN